MSDWNSGWPEMTSERRAWLDELKVGHKVLVGYRRQTPGSRNTAYVEKVNMGYFVVFGDRRFSRRTGYEIGKPKDEYQRWIDRP